LQCNFLALGFTNVNGAAATTRAVPRRDPRHVVGIFARATPSRRVLGRHPRAPILLDAVLPVAPSIAMLALTIWLFGRSATAGLLQVALLLGAGLELAAAR
jgi:hypothetical protein